MSAERNLKEEMLLGLGPVAGPLLACIALLVQSPGYGAAGKFGAG